MKKIIIGLFALSTFAMAAQDTTNNGQGVQQGNPNPYVKNNTAKGSFTNRLGFNFAGSGKEDWENDGDSVNVYDNSVGLDYKLMYNATERFRIGLELGFDSSKYSSDMKNAYDVDSDRIGMALYGITGEFDIIKNANFALYINGSLGGAYNELDAYDYNNRLVSETMKASSYAKIGLGTRFNDFVGVEIGRRVVRYDYTSNYYENDTLTRAQTYVELTLTL